MCLLPVEGELQCLNLMEGEMIPRPMGSQLITEYPGEVLMLDYIKMGITRSDFQYALMLVDKFTRLTEFVPTRSVTSSLDAAGKLLAPIGLTQALKRTNDSVSRDHT